MKCGGFSKRSIVGCLRLGGEEFNLWRELKEGSWWCDMVLTQFHKVRKDSQLFYFSRIHSFHTSYLPISVPYYTIGALHTSSDPQQLRPIGT
jgi:hypothetical protein